LLKAIKNHRPVTLVIALMLTVALTASCFLPVPGFRDENKPPPPQLIDQPPQPDSTSVATDKPPKKRGVYHTVQSGESVYRVSKMYGVPQEKVIRSNKIKDVTKVKVGEVLFIPGARKVRSDPGSSPAVSNSSRTPSGKAIPPPPTRSVHTRCPPGSIKFTMPAEGKLSSGFGIRNGRQHDGIDITNKIGTPIKAAADGVVIYSGRLGGYGLIVILKHEGSFKTIYAHNRKNLVKKGDTVRQGQTIVELGQSGNATGPHLHFEIRCGQDATDPVPYLPK